MAVVSIKDHFFAQLATRLARRGTALIKKRAWLWRGSNVASGNLRIRAGSTAPKRNTLLNDASV
jgi:hypothetical protein